MDRAVGGWIREPASATRGGLLAFLDAHGATTLPVCGVAP
jgi:hypothetical protein